MLIEYCLLLACCVFVSATNSSHHSQIGQYCISSRKPLPNYYWRKYEGVIPHDAVPGGHTSSGSITYIGQVLVLNSKHNALLPGTIEIDKKEVVAPFFGVYTSQNYAAILCSDTPSALKWRPVNEHELHMINDYLVVGGYEINQPAYIGRASHSNYLIVGKVFTETIKGLRIVIPAKKELLLKSFEVLVYDPPDLDFDIRQL